MLNGRCAPRGVVGGFLLPVLYLELHNTMKGNHKEHREHRKWAPFVIFVLSVVKSMYSKLGTPQKAFIQNSKFKIPPCGRASHFLGFLILGLGLSFRGETPLERSGARCASHLEEMRQPLSLVSDFVLRA